MLYDPRATWLRQELTSHNIDVKAMFAFLRWPNTVFDTCVSLISPFSLKPLIRWSPKMAENKLKTQKSVF